MRKSKVTDEQLTTLIKAGMSNSKIAKELCVTPGAINTKCKKIRESLPEPSGTPNEEEAAPMESVPWEDLKKGTVVLWGKNPFVVQMADGETCVLIGASGQKLHLTKKEFERRNFSAIPKGWKQKMTINYELEGLPKQELDREPIIKKELEPEKETEEELEPKPPLDEAEGVLEKPKESEDASEMPTQSPKKECGMAWISREEHNEVHQGFRQQNAKIEDRYEHLIMSRARKDVARFKNVRAEIQNRLDAAEHIPEEILLDYEKLIQIARKEEANG